MLDTVYYISQGETVEEHLLNIKNVCEAGVGLVQLRLKGLAESDLILAAEAAQAICDGFDAKLIINDNVAVAKNVNAYGVHLGLGDSSVKEARKMLGVDFKIGGTANTFDDCLKQIRGGVDYIGLGPYRFTNTKKNLSSILGIEGYNHIVCKLQKAGFDIPIYAIGGIRIDDLLLLRKTKVYGVALSSELSGSTCDDRNQKCIELRKSFPLPDQTL